MSMFIFIISGMVWMAAYILTRRMQQHEEFQRRQQQARVYLRPAGTGTGTWLIRGRKKTVFAWLELLAGMQEALVPRAWALRMENRLAVLPDWQNRRASQWLALKESGAAAAICAGWLLSLPGWATVLLGCAGFYLPEAWLREQMAARLRACLRELPNALDVLAGCTDAGLAFEKALEVVAGQSRPGPWQQELQEMQRRLRLGQSRREAWEHLSRRLNDPEVAALTRILAQAERLGTGVSQILQGQAARLRTRLAQRAEKAAQEAPVKLLFPLILFIFPVVFIVLLGPILLYWWQAF